MTIGLILLAVVSILIFFGVTERFFIQMGLKNWLAFLLVLALVVGAIVPSVSIGTLFSVNVGGFIIPLVIMVMLMAIMRSGMEIFRTVIAMLAVASVAVAARMLVEPANAGLILTSSLIVGFVGGAVAFLAGQSRLGTLAAVMGGIMLGDIITNFLYRFVLGGYAFSLGSYGVFDSIVIAAVFGIIMCETVSAIKRLSSHRRVARTALMAESAEDINISDNAQENGNNGNDAHRQKNIESAEDYQAKNAKRSKKSKARSATQRIKQADLQEDTQKSGQPQSAENQHDDFFDDYV